MGKRVALDKDSKAVLLWNQRMRNWEDRTSSITAIYTAHSGLKHTGYTVYFRGSQKAFFYKKENVRFATRQPRKIETKPTTQSSMTSPRTGERFSWDTKTVDVLLFDAQEARWRNYNDTVDVIHKSYLGDTHTGYTVTFNKSKQTYFYKKENVRFVRKEAYRKPEQRPQPSEVATPSPPRYAHLQEKMNSLEDFQAKKIQRITQYYRGLATAAARIAEKDTPLYFLANSYSQMVFYNSSVLNDLFLRKTKNLTIEGPIIAPFVFNQSQLTAIQRALSHSVSVIEGPPGTGKTQTILNLIANLVMRGNTCAVVSNNNTAIDNVQEKFQATEYTFLLARLGNRHHVETFFAIQNDEALKHFKSNSTSEISVEKKIADLHKEMKRIQEAEIKRSELEEEIRALQLEQKHHTEEWTKTKLLTSQASSHSYTQFLVRLQEPRKIRWFERWRLNRKFGTAIQRLDHSALLDEAEYHYYRVRLEEVNEELETLRKILEPEYRKSVETQLQEYSLLALSGALQKHYGGYRKKTFDPQTFKRTFNAFINRYPVILSTAQSLMNNIPGGFIFDYLIIDEASQGDLLSSILALNHARNVIVIGDSKQLQQIEEEALFDVSAALAEELEIPPYFRYEANSILSTVKNAISNVPTTLLREHYRCVPTIINFCNQMFYDNQLIVMTQDHGQHINIIKTVEGNHAYKNPTGTGLYNQREIDEVGVLVEDRSERDIGIIAPFRYQADLLSQHYGTETIEADTIHRFQGREKEEIILSFTVNDVARSDEDHVSDFVTNHQLLNVAISRAKNSITAIVSHNVYHSKNNPISDFIRYAEYHYGSAKESTISSIFDILHSDYSKEYLRLMLQRSGEYQSEIEMRALITTTLLAFPRIGFAMHHRLSKLLRTTKGFTVEDTAYLLHPWTHVDFIFYNKVTKQALFALEVDGVTFHEQRYKQRERDRLKDRALLANGIDVHRFKTNQSGEQARLKGILAKYV